MVIYTTDALIELEETTYTEWLVEQDLVSLGEEEKTVQLNIKVEDITNSEKGSDESHVSDEGQKDNLETENTTFAEPQDEEKEDNKNNKQIGGSGYVKKEAETDEKAKLAKLTEDVQSMIKQSKMEEDCRNKINRLEMILNSLQEDTSSKTTNEDGKESTDSKPEQKNKKHDVNPEAKKTE